MKSKTLKVLSFSLPLLFCAFGCTGNKKPIDSEGIFGRTKNFFNTLNPNEILIVQTDDVSIKRFSFDGKELKSLGTLPAEKVLFNSDKKLVTAVGLPEIYEQQDIALETLGKPEVKVAPSTVEALCLGSPFWQDTKLGKTEFDEIQILKSGDGFNWVSLKSKLPEPLGPTNFSGTLSEHVLFYRYFQNGFGSLTLQFDDSAAQDPTYFASYLSLEEPSEWDGVSNLYCHLNRRSTPVVTPGQQIFTTEQRYLGGFGSVYIADYACQYEARAAGLSGVWKALLSDSSQNASSRIRFSPIGTLNFRPESLGGPQMVTNPTNSIWRKSMADLNYTAKGLPARLVGEMAWTGTSRTGSFVEGSNCSNWTSSEPESVSIGGYPNHTGDFLVSYHHKKPCNTPKSFYCINEQRPSQAPPDPVNFSAILNVGTVALSWSSGGGTTGTYKIAYQEGTVPPVTCDTGKVANAWALAPVATTYVLRGLTPLKTYSIRLCASNSDLSAYSKGITQTVTIPDKLPETTQVIFSTKNTYVAGNLGSIYFADYACQKEALMSGLGGVWKAIISDSQTNARDRILSTRAIFNMRPLADGGPQLVANDYYTMWSWAVKSPVMYNASGGAPGYKIVITGSNTSGSYDSTRENCNDYKDIAARAVGSGSNTSVEKNWLGGYSRGCYTANSLYCINQQLPSETPPNPENGQATVLSPTSIQLNWTSGGGTTAAYQISYQLGTVPPEDCQSGKVIPASFISLNAKSFTLFDLSPGEQYTFRICAANSDLSQFSHGVVVK